LKANVDVDVDVEMEYDDLNDDSIQIYIEEHERNVP
jgi:hypothetical protein